MIRDACYVTDSIRSRSTHHVSDFMSATITLFETGARPGAMGFMTDTTLCIGCKACEVACKQWNQLPLDDFGFTGFSYDNTGDLGATTWRHVAFVERIGDEDGRRPTSLKPFQS